VFHSVTDVTHAMQTAVAPVFLIMGAGTLLASMSVRFGRVIDRARVLMDRGQLDWSELRVLHRRARLLRLTIILNSASIFCVALTIFVIFGSLLFSLDLPVVVPTLFSLSVALMIAALGFFIKDFAISLRVFEAQLAACKSTSSPTEQRS
jgi:hypothetical protein